MVGSRYSVLALAALCFALGCGESDSPEPDGTAGEAGANSGAGGSAGSTTASGGTSGRAGASGAAGSATTAGRGGAAGSATTAGRGGANAGSAGSSGSAGAATSGSAGQEEAGGGAGMGSGGAGTGGEPGETGGSAGAPSDWRAACNGVTVNGRCDGSSYQWCDYFTRQVQTIDCGALGMTCRALETESNEDDGNGCVGEPCSSSGFFDYCLDEALIADCFMGETVVTSCVKRHGGTAVCTEPGENAVCNHTEICDIPSLRCDGSVLRICDEGSRLHYRDCARMNPAGTCTEIDSTTVDCGGVTVSLVL